MLQNHTAGADRARSEIYAHCRAPPAIQAVRLDDGTWSVSQLLPLPKFGDRSPVDMEIDGGQLIIFDPQEIRRPRSGCTI